MEFAYVRDTLVIQSSCWVITITYLNIISNQTRLLHIDRSEFREFCKATHDKGPEELTPPQKTFVFLMLKLEL